MPIPRRRRRTAPVRDIQIRFAKNINLLDRPLFIPSRIRIDRNIYNDQNGYELFCPNGLPVSNDIDILNLLLHKSQITNQHIIEFDSTSEFLGELGYSLGERNYDFVRASLERWGQTIINFQQGTFYIGRGRYSRLTRTGILQVNRLDDKGIRIELNRAFLDINNASNFSINFPLKLMGDLSPFSKRLFEILRKNENNFGQKFHWKIGINKLRRKMPILNTITDSKLLYQVQDSCNEINEKIPRYGMRYGYYVERGGQRYQILIFTKGLVHRRTRRDTIRTEDNLFRT